MVFFSEEHVSYTCAFFHWRTIQFSRFLALTFCFFSVHIGNFSSRFVAPRNRSFIFFIFLSPSGNVAFNLQQNLIFGYRMLSSRILLSIILFFIALFLFQSILTTSIKAQFVSKKQIFRLITNFPRNIRRFRRGYSTQEKETKGTPSPLSNIISVQTMNCTGKHLSTVNMPILQRSGPSGFQLFSISLPQAIVPCPNNKEQESSKKHIIVSLQWS